MCTFDNDTINVGGLDSFELLTPFHLLAQL